MQKVLDKNLFLVYTASYTVFYPDFKRTIDTLYQKQKFRFYEKAKNNPYYNHSFFADGSLEREVACKRAFGILLCAEDDESLKKTIGVDLAEPAAVVDTVGNMGEALGSEGIDVIKQVALENVAVET